MARLGLGFQTTCHVLALIEEDIGGLGLQGEHRSQCGSGWREGRENGRRGDRSHTSI